MGRESLGRFATMVVLTVGAVGCNRNQGPDPAAANMAPTSVDQSPPVQPAAEATGEEAQLTAAPEAPPPLPTYSQPPCPGDNYLWTPDYWAYSADGYYWVPGAWVTAPWVGALWTPPWWGYTGGRYLWHAGYWGPYVGFYGGINYGFGYTGLGYYGGYWGGGAFHYNRAALNVNTSIVHNVYDRHVENYTPANRISYNGARGGINMQPNTSQMAAMRARRMGALPAQTQMEHEAAGNRAQFASENRGKPAMVTAERPVGARPAAPAEEHSADRVRAPEARTPETRPAEARPEARAPEARPEARPAARPEAARPEARPPEARPAAPRPEARPEARTPETRPEARPEPNRPATPHAEPPRAQAPPAAHSEPHAAPPAAHSEPHAAPAAKPAPQSHPPEPQKKDNKH